MCVYLVINILKKLYDPKIQKVWLYFLKFSIQIIFENIISRKFIKFPIRSI